MKNAIGASWATTGRDPPGCQGPLEGHLRGVLTALTPEEVNEDRLKFAGALLEEAEVDFDRLGLQPTP